MATRSVEAVLKEKQIYQIVNQKLVSAEPTTPLNQIIELMQKNRAGYVVVAKNKKLYGMFTEIDLVEKVLCKQVSWQEPIRRFMTKKTATLTPEDSVEKAIRIMGEQETSHLPIVGKDKKLAGVLSVRTLIRFLGEFYPTEVYNLPPDTVLNATTQEGG